ncbi:MAG: c-type cytochrome [Candidatus Rokubacteria bacterium]|nr:c-type cytochrome [Candidatus Rokubacteria bacterium]MBI2554318.1 c-type cytochrome [Candidatus Rokubacteria bacterium]
MTNSIRLLVGCASLILGLALYGGAAAGPLDAPGYAKAFSCSACHGFAGASAADTVPVLAGMPSWYLKKAIQDYASGKRPAAEMESYSKMVLELGVDDVAAYFAGQKKQPTPVKADPAAVARGKAASTQCVVCHGPEGKGDPAKGIPDLTGQPPGYLKNQMLLFKADRRSPGDETLKALKALMRTIPDEAFGDLAAYYSSLR